MMTTATTKRKYLTDLVTWHDDDWERIWEFSIEFDWEDSDTNFGLESIGWGRPDRPRIKDVSGYWDNSDIFQDCEEKPFVELHGDQVIAAEKYLQKMIVDLDDDNARKYCLPAICEEYELDYRDYLY